MMRSLGKITAEGFPAYYQKRVTRGARVLVSSALCHSRLRIQAPCHSIVRLVRPVRHPPIVTLIRITFLAGAASFMSPAPPTLQR